MCIIVLIDFEGVGKIVTPYRVQGPCSLRRLFA